MSGGGPVAVGARYGYGRGHAAAALAVAAVLLSGGCGEGTGKGAADTADPEPPAGSSAPATSAPQSPGAGPGDAGKLLDGLTVRKPGSMDGYSRDRFPHWSEQQGNCDTREAVLKRDGEDVRTDRSCKAVSGSWRSPYDGETWTEASDVDIDHMVPLAEAWRSGARTWSDDRREALANDMDRPQLLAVTDNVNQSKGDSPPDDWKPELKSYWCTYAQNWVAVKHHYELSVTTEEKSALREMLGRCER
ncbi:HNH endonuclease [Streptomyces armeniacus]|uniref:HNH endonuclease n=1 Tax=Streptomyces armeniacus TaxID=83291 RepID=A0A345Y144_9ACTN|nr:HNH endonuclease [Streptomyces armeniacus]